MPPSLLLRLFLSGLLLCGILGGSHAAAAPLQLTPEVSGQRANIHSDIFHDSDATLGIADILRPEIQRQFTPSAGVAGGGIEPTAHWLRLTVQRPAGDQNEWWLEVHPLNLYDLRIYWPNSDGTYREILSGERIPFLQGREEIYRQYAFRLPLEGDKPLTFYVRAHDPGGAVFPISLLTRDDLNQTIRIGELLTGLIYGLVIGLVIYNLFLAVSLRDQAYLWYVCSSLGLLWFIAHLMGHTAQYLWPEWPEAVAAGRVIIPALWGLFLALFIISFFQLEKHLPLAWRVYQLIAVSYILIIALRLSGAHATSAFLLSCFPFGYVPLTLVVAVMRWRQGFHSARYFLFGYGVVLACTTLFIMRIQGMLNPSLWTEYAVPVGAAFEALVFSLALADRISDLRKQGSRAQIDELTGAGNRRLLDQQFEEARLRADRLQRKIGIVAIDLDKFKPINDSHGHAAGDVVLQAIARRLQGCLREHDCLARIGGDEFVILLTDLESAEAAAPILDRLLAVCRSPISHGGLMLNVTPSMGMACYPDDGGDLASLNRCADTALYTAKKAGRNQLCQYTSGALLES